MANATILGTDLSTYTIGISGTSVSTDANYPISNLSTYEPLNFWSNFDLSPYNFPFYVTINFPSAKTCDTGIISVSSDFSSTNNVYLQYSNNAAFTSGTGQALAQVSLIDGANIYYMV